ncbi:hypothetical protein ABFC53_07855 [Stenotrophomonas pavanii]|uniref:hypothetical protein n=1 Tax=Stenotrophomonas pavanii TaxID=487698 RepID=UPI00320FB597
MDVEQRARELLADEFARSGELVSEYADEVRSGITHPWDRAAIRAIISALTPPDGSDQNLLELAATFETCIAFLPPAGRRNIAKAVDQLRYKGMTTAEGHVVVTRNEAGQAVAVTRQDDEGRILSVIAELETPEGWVEQHERDSRELRRLCAARDEARKERDIAKNRLTRMRAALEKIAGYRLDQFAGAYDMASACIYDAENALLADPEVPDGRG